MKILVRPGSTIKEKTPSVIGFLNSLGAQATRYAEPQSCEVTPSTTLNLFGIRVPMTRELIQSAEWEYQIIRKQGTFRFTINGITVAAKCVGKLEAAWIRSLPQDLENLTLTHPKDKAVAPGNLATLAPLEHLIRLNLSGWNDLVDLGGIESLNSIRVLNLSESASLVNLAPLASLHELRVLNLANCKILEDLSALATLECLRYLDLSRSRKIRDCDSLRGLKLLKTLRWTYCDKLKDVDLLTGIRSLELLDLRYCSRLEDLSGLTQLENLKSLTLANSKAIKSIEALASLQQLENLNISGCDSLGDLRPLANLHALVNLDLSHCSKIRSVAALSRLQSLTSLDLSDCYQVNNLRPLASLKNLESLAITGMKRLKSIEPLRSLPKLRKLRSSFHPGSVAGVLASLAVTRTDVAMISDSAKRWLAEAMRFDSESLAEAENLTSILGEAFNRLPQEHEVLPHYEAFLIRHREFSARPWKSWLLGSVRHHGFNLLRQRVERLPLPKLSPGGIGGVCAALPDGDAPLDPQDWARKWLDLLHQYRSGHAQALLQVSAEICLAHARLGMPEALERWLLLFTDPSDPTTLDPVQTALGLWQLERGNFAAAYHHAAAVQLLKHRDPLLLQLAEGCLETNPQQAGEILLMIHDPALRERLLDRLARDPVFIASPINVQRMVAAAGDSPPALAKLIGAMDKSANPSLLSEISALLQADVPTFNLWRLACLEDLARQIRLET
jgi:Leucine-rich repeat (LRR) protein